MVARLLLIALCVQFNSAFADDDTVAQTRVFGQRVQQAVDRDAQGVPPSLVEIAQLQKELDDLNSIGDAADLSITKRRAIGRLLGVLNYRVGHQLPAKVGTPPIARTQVNTEIISSKHGAVCSSALGLVPDRATEVVLARGQDAWLFVPARIAQQIRFATESHGADPAIEIFGSCKQGATPLASDDDEIGLDAIAVVASGDHDQLFVRLTNTGVTGAVSIIASGAPGSINGLVKDGKTGTPIGGAGLTLITYSQGYYSNAGFSGTDSNGNFTITPAQPGSYYLLASATNYLTQLYPSGFCGYRYYYDFSSCDFSHATAVDVPATGVVSNINFSMSGGAKIAGQVRATDNQPLPATVQFVSADGQTYAAIPADAAGHFTFTTIPPGSYILKATYAGYSSQLYDHITCGGALKLDCNLALATPVVVGSADVMNVNFSLQLLSSFSGKLSDENGVLTNYQGYVSVLDTSGNLVASSYTDGAGHYATNAVPPGMYYLAASSNGYYAQLFNGHDCGVNCAAETAQATPIVVSSDGQRIQQDFILDPLPSLLGHVVDSTSGSPLANVQIFVNTQPPIYFSYPNYSAYTNSDGDYAVAAVPAGQYFVWALSPNHIDQIYSDIPCESTGTNGNPQARCDVSNATLLEVSPGQSLPKFNFSLEPSLSISGVALTRAGTGSDLPAINVSVLLYDGTGAIVANGAVDAMGKYAVSDLAPGTYYAVAMGYTNPGIFVSQQWRNKDCAGVCNATAGTPINVTKGNSAAGIDFQLIRVDAVVGQVTDDHGAPIAGVVIDLFSTADNSYVSGAATDTQGYYAVTAASGMSYYAATESGGGFIDQVYSNIACPNGTAYEKLCSLTGATPVNLGSGTVQPHIANFVLAPRDRIFSDDFQ